MVLFIKLYKVGPRFEFLDGILQYGHSSKKLLSSTFQWCTMLYKEVLLPSQKLDKNYMEM